MRFGSPGLGVKVTKMGIGNTSAIIKTVIVGHFLSSIAKTKGMERVLMKKKSKTNQEAALSVTYHANFHENNKHLYLLLG